MPSKERAFAVWLNQSHVGHLYTRDNYTWFVFDQAYVQDPQRAVLGLWFEQHLSTSHAANVRLPPWFSNLLPEGQLREWIAQKQQVAEVREMELLAGVGHDLPGAVIVLQDDNPTGRAPGFNEAIPLYWPTRANDDPWRFSLAGVGLKFSMLQKGERFTAPAVGEGGDWIIKLPDHRYADVPCNEYAMMRLAQEVGLDVPEIKLVHRDLLADIPAHLWPPNEDRAFAIKRFDRMANGQRVHIEDLAQVRGKYPEAKYEGSFETVAALMYRGHDRASLIEFAKRLAFNILIGNGDAHLKNWSLLYKDPRIPTISPAYDLVATAIYRPLGEPENLGLKFGGSLRFEAVSLQNFDNLQKTLRVTDALLPEQVQALVEAVQNRWAHIEALVSHSPLLLSIQQGLDARAKNLLRRPW